MALVSLLVVSVYEVANYSHEVKWKTGLPFGTYNTLVSPNGTIYTNINNTIYVIGPDGKIKGTLPEGGPSLTMNQNGTMFFESAYGGKNSTGINALSTNGSIIWIYKAANGAFSQPQIGPNDTVYVTNTFDNNTEVQFLAISPQGVQLWNKTLPYIPFCILSDNATILLGEQDKNLTAYGSRGQILWETNLTVFPDFPVLVNGTMYGLDFTSDGVRQRMDLCAVSLNSSLLWRYSSTQISSEQGSLGFGYPMTDGQGAVYFTRTVTYIGASRHVSTLYALNPDGTVRWTYSDEWLYSPTIHDDTIVMGTSSGLTALDLNGHVKWKMDLPYVYEAPAFGNDGTIYVTTEDGIVAIGENPIVLEVGLLILVPIIVGCLVILWSIRNSHTP